LESTVANDSFSPLSVDFSSVVSGWALGTITCRAHSMCLSLVKSVNAGRSWSVSALPSSLLHLADRRVNGKPSIEYDTLYGVGALNLSVRFANAKDGWIYGSLAVPSKVDDESPSYFASVLWSTHVGGLIWSERQSWIRGQGTVLDLEATTTTVYAMALNNSDDVTVESSPVGTDRWRVSDAKGLDIPAGGGELSGAIVLSGSHGWLVEGNDRGVSGSDQLSARGQWVPWSPPCYSVGNTLTVPAVSNATTLLAQCQMGGYASPLSRTAPPGATVGSTWLYVSSDAGRTFTAGSELGPDSDFFGPELASPRLGTILTTARTPQNQYLRASFDSGRHWSNVYTGNVTFLRFIGPNEGVALVQRFHGPNRLIMTFDGGRDWLPMPF
jgi:hypothetical protein